MRETGKNTELPVKTAGFEPYVYKFLLQIKRTTSYNKVCVVPSSLTDTQDFFFFYYIGIHVLEKFGKENLVGLD